MNEDLDKEIESDIDIKIQCDCSSKIEELISLVKELKIQVSHLENRQISLNDQPFTKLGQNPALSPFTTDQPNFPSLPNEWVTTDTTGTVNSFSDKLETT